MMTLTLVQKPIKFGDGSPGVGQFATDGTNFWPISILGDKNGQLGAQGNVASIPGKGHRLSSGRAIPQPIRLAT